MKDYDTAQAFIQLHANDDLQALALLLVRHPELDRNYILTQIKGLQALKQKVPSWAGLTRMQMPPTLSLEQCSSELTAVYKASLCKGESVTDLTGGFGVDFAWLAGRFSEATYVEQQELLCEAARHNFNLLGLAHARVVRANATEYLRELPHQSCIYLDPARRNQTGGKTFLLQECQPDLTILYSELLSRCNQLMVKLSPMLDLSLALQQMPYTQAIHVVSVENECKELLWISAPHHAGAPVIYCINLHARHQPQIFILQPNEEQNATCAYADWPETYLYEPNSSILKAGAFKSVAQRFQLQKLHPHSHLYTSANRIEAFPGRSFVVESVFGFGKQELRHHLSAYPKANLTIRNFPGSVADLRKRLQLKEGGDSYLFATTLADEKKALILCRREAPQS